ncbi:MAG: COQ9 family protein [Sphingomonadales bacterium]|jgi:ubiquinone biosynthesis protein COQ9
MAKLVLEDDRTPDEWRQDIIEAILIHVPFDGWGDNAINRAADDLGLTRGFIDLAFPKGLSNMITFFLEGLDQKLIEGLRVRGIEKMRIRDKISLAIRLKLEINDAYREAVHRTVTWLAMPLNVPLGAKLLWKTADVMWSMAGDTATDYNHYTKRGILSGVYSSTLLYWLNDNSVGYEDTWAFLDRRIENVMQFEKVKSKVVKATEGLPDVAAVLGQWRYGDQQKKDKDGDS